VRHRVLGAEIGDHLLTKQANRLHHLRVGHRAQLKIEHLLFDTDGGELLDKFDTILGAAHGETGGLDQITAGDIVSTAAASSLREVEFIVVSARIIR
jgi:hypothetical protein